MNAAFLKTLSRLNPAVCKIHLFPYRIRHERNSLATDNITQLPIKMPAAFTGIMIHSANRKCSGRPSQITDTDGIFYAFHFRIV